MVNGRAAKRARIIATKTRTAVRRGRKSPVEEVLTPTPPPQPIQPPPPPQPKQPFAVVGDEVFRTRQDFLKAKNKAAPCGDFKPFAVNRSTGEIFCTAQDFSDAGFRLPKGTKKSQRGLPCPEGLTFWNGKCRKVSFSEATFL